MSDPPIFFTIEDRNKEAPWGDTWKIQIWVQDKILEAEEYLLTPTKSLYQIPTNLEEFDKDTIGSDLMR